MRTNPFDRLVTSSLTMTLILCGSLHAHFVFVKSVSTEDGEREAVVYFSEAAHVDGDRLPEKIKPTKLWLRTAKANEQTELKIGGEDRDGWIAMFGQLGKSNVFSLEACCDYGIYHGTMLRYCAKHLRCLEPSELKRLGVAKQFQLDIVPAMEGSQLTFTTLWNGDAIADVELTVEDSAGGFSKLITDEHGKATFDAARPGLYSARVNHEVPDASGTHDGESYQGVSYYTTLTLNVGDVSRRQAVCVASEVTIEAATLAATRFEASSCLLPEAVSSFGGVVCNDHLYVYSGHTGEAHAHSRHNLSQHFRRISLKTRDADWEELPSGTPLQGLPLVTYDGAVYRIGGLRALNDDVETPDLHSTNEFARFDPSTKTWTRLTDLPEPRSSHDAVVVGKTLYVVGGWNLEGDEEGHWHQHALSADLSVVPIRWTRIAVPFQRRALAVSHADNKLYVIGGMDSNHEITRTVLVFNAATNRWTSGPELPGDGMQGFGVSAWNLDGHVFVSGTADHVLRLAPDRTRWTTVQELANPRFFHRLVPAPNGDLLAVGGASMASGHLRDIERIQLATRLVERRIQMSQPTEQK